MLSTERPISLMPFASNSLERRPNSVSSVEQTGVKSAGWEKRSAHFPSRQAEKVSSPWVVIAVKSGAGSPIFGIDRAGAAGASAMASS